MKDGSTGGHFTNEGGWASAAVAVFSSRTYIKGGGIAQSIMNASTVTSIMFGASLCPLCISLNQ